jgi:ABC-2 type transport system ATP-binding protein
MIKANNLVKHFKNSKTPAINNLSFEVKKGDIVGLIGPDGAGKTTLVRLMTGLLEFDSGELEILGVKMPNLTSEFLKQIGYMPQKFGLYEDLSVKENIELYASLQEILNIKERIEELLTFTKLAPFWDRRACDLSGGMKQKLAMACALIKKPQILLLDEPSVGVDPMSRRDLWDMIKKLSQDNITIIWATSYLNEAQMCDNVLLLNNGNLLYGGSPKELTDNLKERTFQIEGDFSNRREAVSLILENDAVLDAAISCSHIKATLKKGFVFPSDILPSLGGNMKAYKTKPVFEDAFIDILNAKTKPRSVLADIMQKMPMRDNIIEARRLTKRFGSFTAAENINFSINSGKIFGLLGPNGAGKSTTFKMLCGLLTPSSGSAKILGGDIKNSKIRKNIGYMAQKFSLYGNLHLKNNLDFFANLYGVKNAKQKIDTMIGIFDFEKYLKTNADELPLGIKQRLALACALMHEPPVLFLDEPTSGVDPITRREFWTHINGMVKKGAAIMVTTHFMDEAEYCDDIMIVYKGKAIAVGTPRELKAKISPEASMEDAFIGLVRQYDERAKS